MIKLYRYRLQFKTAFHNAGYSWKFRKGLIIRYTGSYIDIASEVAPLPGFSSESILDVLKIFASNHNELNEFLYNVYDQNQIKIFFTQHTYPPSIQFGISCLALDLICHRNNKAQFPAAASQNSSPIAVNAVIGISSKHELSNAIQKLYKAGFRTVKLKCGSEPSHQLEVIKRVADVFPELKFRLDANRSWPGDKAMKILEGFSGLPIEYCEEPCHFRSLNEMAGFRASSPIPIAIDESVSNFRTASKILELHAADVIIIKPMMLGNIPGLIETFTPEHTHTIDRVCTTSLESAVGRSSVAKAASVFGSGHLAHGLDSGRLMKEDVFADYKEPGLPKADVPVSWCTNFSRCDENKLSEIDL